ncbi:RraA family protein [Kurthia senegalensis]|uniref:RraA family protein n=1 Tax=Kurthia senegalensis TaxID=1033740 RepID=UPI0002895EB8|nr:RraA family protein [Kurthia senegalensis]
MKAIEQLPTTAISDALKGKNHLPASIKPLAAHYRLIGKAVTVKLPIYENGAVMEAMLVASPGDVLVVDIQNDTTRAIAGDFVLSMMQKLGLAGVVVYGAIRDVEAAKNLDFPIFVTGTTTAAGVKNGGGQVNVPLTIEKTTIHPGDLIVGDADGVVVVPAMIVDEVMLDAKEKMEKDTLREQTVLKTTETIQAHLREVTSKF